MTIKIGIYNHSTGDNIARDATKEEIAVMEVEKTETQSIKDKVIIKAEADAIAKQAILDRLGLTSEEAALLLG
jgi:hypothetical protein